MANEINVIQLYNTINTLAKVYHAGYDSKEDFNNKLKATEIGLLKLFHDWDEDDQTVTDFLLPFRVNGPLLANDKGFVTLPEDYAFKSSILGVYTENPCDANNPTIIKPIPAFQLRSNEVAMVLNSAIAKPSMEHKRYYYTFRNGGIQLFPEQLRAIEMTYLRYPKYGQIDFTYSIVGGEDVAVPNAETSVNLQWKDVTFEYFKYAMLFLLGVELKETALINASQMEKLASVFKYK
jgi:hypothetical protein